MYNVRKASKVLCNTLTIQVISDTDTRNYKISSDLDSFPTEPDDSGWDKDF